MPRTAVVTGASSGIGAATRPRARRRRLPRRLRRPAQGPDRGARRGDRRHGGGLRRHRRRLRARSWPSVGGERGRAGQQRRRRRRRGHRRGGRRRGLGPDVRPERARHGPRDPGPAPRAARRRRRSGGQHGLDRGPGRLRGRRRLHRGQARREGDHPDAAARAGRRAAPVHRDRPRDGQDRGVRAEPVRGRPGAATTRSTRACAEPLVAEDIAEMVRWVASLPVPREHRRARRTPSGAGRPAQGAPRRTS